MIRPGINVLGRPSIGISPFVAPNIPQTNFSIGDNGLIQTAPSNDSKRPDLVQEETKLPKSVNFLADHSGCGFWRMFWPADQLNSRVESVVMSSCQMIHDELFFSQLKTVRIQRQATENQHRYVTYLEKMREKFNFNLVYEIDDIMYYEDIPEYNKFKPGFSDPKIAEFCSLIMMTCDEITTTNKFIADYYAEKSGNKNVTVIPNYPPKWWIGNYYDEKKISQNFDKNRNKPRILYAGSGAHIDVEGRCKYKDDFYHILDVVRKTVDQYQWVFFGAPCICQDIVTYKEADYKFTSGDDLIDQIKKLVKSKDEFMRASRKHRARSERRFLECPDNLGKWKELYHYKYGAPERKLINELNGIA